MSGPSDIQGSGSASASDADAPSSPSGPARPPATRAERRDGSAVDRDLFGQPPKKHRDWSHRRGEPRVLALGWTLYLMACTVLMFGSLAIRPRAMGAEMYRPAARTLVVLVAIGIGVLWPMVRLSQEPPHRRLVLGGLLDWCVLLLPAQAIIWPQVVLAGWPPDVVAVQALLLSAWGLMIGGALTGVLGLCTRLEGVGSASLRTLTMIAILAVVAGAPMMIASVGPPPERGEPITGWWLSPVVAVFEIGRDRLGGGRAAEVLPQHWDVAARTAWAGIAVWVAGAALAAVAARRMATGPGNA